MIHLVLVCQTSNGKWTGFFSLWEIGWVVHACLCQISHQSVASVQTLPFLWGEKYCRKWVPRRKAEIVIFWVLHSPSVRYIISNNWTASILYRDRLRTTTNVLGDSIGTGIVEYLSRHELQSKDAEMGNSVVEEKDKKSYQLIAHENEHENEKPPVSETKM